MIIAKIVILTIVVIVAYIIFKKKFNSNNFPTVSSPSLLSLPSPRFSNAKPKIADYAFTTVVPNLGVCDIDGRIDDLGKVRESEGVR